MSIDSIIFDLDGTLWDSSGSVINAWNETIRGYDEVKGELTIDDLKSVMGLVIGDIAVKFFPYLEEERRLEIAKHCGKNENAYLEKHGGALFSGLEEALKKLGQDHKLFIVSNCQCGYIEAFYKFHKLDRYFTDYECTGKTGMKKGENIKLIIERNNLKNPVYVGDTVLDLEASRFAGIPFIYARYGFGEVEDYDYVIDSVYDIIGIVEERI